MLKPKIRRKLGLNPFSRHQSGRNISYNSLLQTDQIIIADIPGTVLNHNERGQPLATSRRKSLSTTDYRRVVMRNLIGMGMSGGGATDACARSRRIARLVC